MLEHMRLAKMSFDLWGALSPISVRQPPGSVEVEQTEQSESKENETASSTSREASAKRTMSQAELESSLYKVIKKVTIIFLNLNVLRKNIY